MTRRRRLRHLPLELAAAASIAVPATLVWSSCSADDPRASIVATPTDAGADAMDALAFDAASCFDVASLCKLHNVACGPLLAFDQGCDIERTVDCGVCRGAATLDTMVPIRGDKTGFKMGNASPTAPDDEKPQKQVAIGNFLVDRVEVSVAQYNECVVAKACTPPATGGACNFGVAGRSEHPINCVDWYQANAFCSYRGRRLPTEPEWEYVARGGASLRTYPWGNQSPTGLAALCWAGGRGDGGVPKSTCPTAREPNQDRTAQSVFDLGANVREWTLDGWSPNYDAPRTATFRVQRGGGWFADTTAASVNAIHRLSSLPTARTADVGFRCVRPLPDALDGGFPADAALP
jgi:formylglycine-generating enzyme required for sulfatase activity